MRTLAAVLIVLAGLLACSTPPVQQRAGVLDYLYPAGMPAAPPTDVQLKLPLRVGLAFAPGSATRPAGSAGSSFWTGDAGMYRPMLDASEQQRLLDRVVAAFKGTEGVQSIQIVPSSLLTPGGGFENVDQLRSLLSIDVIALLSYEQTQFQDYKKASLSYLTVVGAYLVKGNQNETHTFVDTTVFDVASRTMLFNAGGRNTVVQRSTAVEASENLREDSIAGFEGAVTAMIAELQIALEKFREQARSGTVRGAGTPAVAMSGGQGAGAAGALEACLGLLLAAGYLLGRRTNHA
jgi:rhombotail lipoprotein